MTQRSPSKSFELFFTPRFPALFIIGALVLAVISNIFTDLVKLYLGDRPAQLWLIFAVSSGLLIVVVVAAYSMGVIRTRLAATEALDVIGQPRPQQYRGLIAFVSLGQRAHLEKAIRYHGEKLVRLWLIATKDAEELALEIKSEYATAERDVSIIPLSDPWNLQAAKSAVEVIYRDHLGPLAEEDVIADFTGGTKTMTVGMIFACLSTSRRLEYVPARYVENKPVEALNPVEYFLDSTIDARAHRAGLRKESEKGAAKV